MESEKNSDVEEKDKQDMFLTNKDKIADIKSKVDLSNVLDAPLQGQDFTNGLNAEVDLDESVDKVDDQTDKGGGSNEDGNTCYQIEKDKVLNGHGENSEIVNEKIRSDEDRDTVENRDHNPVEAIQDQSAESNSESFHDNKFLNDTVVTGGTMGNNLEAKEQIETSDNSKHLSQLDENNVVKNEELESNEQLDKSENNNEKEIHEVNAETRKTEEKLETDVDKGVEVSREGELCESKKMERNEPIEKNSFENHLENCSKVEDVYVETEHAFDFRKKDIVNGENDKDEEKIEEEIIDREKIQNFIKEVIKDLHGIVIETENCDSVVNDMYEESTRSELVNDKEVNDDENKKVQATKVSEISESNITTDVTANLVKVDRHVESSNVLKISNTESEKPCELVIEENTDVTKNLENCISKAENMQKSEEKTTNEDNKALEISIEKSDALSDTCDRHLQKRFHNEEDPMHSQEEQYVAEPTQNTLPVTRKAKNDLKMVEEELKIAQAALQKSQQCLQDEHSKHNRDVMTLKLQMYRSQMELKRQKSKSEKQLTEIMSHLVMLESRLRKEQLRLKRETRDKDNFIETQKHEIVKLKDQNEQLLNAIKEICAKGGMNGYMRENRRKNGNYTDGIENSAKATRDKKGHTTGKLGSMKDKFMAKNRSSLELNSFSLEKYLIKDERLCSSQEDLHRLGEERRRSIPTINERATKNQRHDTSPKDRPTSDSSEYKNGRHKKQVRYSQNFFSDAGSPQYEMNKSVSDSSQLSESTNSSSGVYSLSDHDLSSHNDSIPNGNHDYIEDDDDDDRIFSFSSTHINTVIAEEEAMGPTMSHSGQMMSMGSMPMLANLKEETMGSGKNRPHSLSSVDLASIQQQAQNIAQLEHRSSPNSTPVMEKCTPPASPSYVHGKNELTPFQTFKTMFRRKGSSKNKGHKKRSVSLSQTTNTEYSEALKKHFQKYDMS